MDESLELYKHILKDSKMSMYSLEKLLEYLKEKDNKIKKKAESILKEYEKYYNEAKECLERENINLDTVSPISKMGVAMGIKKEVISDNSDSSIADMLIKGISMGSIDMEKKISAYKDEADKSEIRFAKNFLKFQQDTIEELKKYL